MKIISVRSLGVQPTYSPEMQSAQHNYITAQSDAVHANSHGCAYYLWSVRSLWLKAKFPSEWWASVMSDCHPDKLARYMAIAKGEGTRIEGVHIDRLTVEFTAVDGVIHAGLIGLKGVGERAAARYAHDPVQPEVHYQDIEQFIARKGNSKTVLERLIKLGSFTHLHPNRYATWQWWLFRYGNGREVTQLRKQIRQRLLLEQGWNEETIHQERTRQIRQYQLTFPTRHKIPDKLLRWKPKPQESLQQIMALFPEDYSTTEILQFEKEYFGYYFSNPLERFQYDPNRSLGSVTDQESGGVGIVHTVIMALEWGKTKNDDEMCRVTISDGVQSCLLLIWSDECERYRELLKKAELLLSRETKLAERIELGIGARVRYSRERKSMTLLRHGAYQQLWELRRAGQEGKREPATQELAGAQ